jgi:DNA-3-methyladenine glycosylase I
MAIRLFADIPLTTHFGNCRGREICYAPWGISAPEYHPYHDIEWGRPVGSDEAIYEKLCLEGFQSGLSWLTILRERDGFRRAFAGFDPAAAGPFA